MKRKGYPQRLNINELRRLYSDEGMSLRAIAAKFGVSHQAVHERLTLAGVELRGRGVVAWQQPIKKSILDQLYIKQRLTVAEIAKQLETSETRVYQSLKAHSIPRVRPAQRSPLGRLLVGEVIHLPKPKRRRFYAAVYDMAKNAGIRVSIRTIDCDQYEVRRIA